MPEWEGTRLSLEYAAAGSRESQLTAPYTPALQRRNTLWVTSKAVYEGRATEQCGLTPTPSACSCLGQARTGGGQLFVGAFNRPCISPRHA